MVDMSASTARRSIACLALGLIVLLVDGYDIFVLGTVGPSLLAYEPWGATPATLGLLGSVTALGMPIGAITAGWAGDLWGRRAPLTISLGWVSVWMLLSAVAPTVGLFAATRLGTGIGIGALVPLVVAFVTDWAPYERRSLFVGIALTGVAFGGLAASLIGRAVLPGLHFQWLFLAGSVPLLLVPVVWRVMPRTVPRADPEATADPVIASSDNDTPNKAAQLFAPGFRRATVLFWTATFLGLVLVYGASTWLPTLMVKAGYDLSSSLEFAVTFNLGAILGTVVVTLIADRGLLKPITVVCFLLAAVAMFTLSTPQPRWLLLTMSALAGLGALGTQNLINSYVARYHPAHIRGTALGFSLGVGRLGAIVGPSYLAAVTVLITFPGAGFYAFIVPAVIGAATIAAIPSRAKAPAGGTEPGGSGVTSMYPREPDPHNTDVIVVGGGPVGLTLAHELGARGVECVLLEAREAPSSGSPRCKQVNPRSMEIFRRLGVADDIRAAAGLPFGWSDSAVFATSLTGHRIERFDQVFALSDVPSADLAEAAQWCAQNRLEEALRRTLRRHDGVTALWGTTVTGVEQDADGVTAFGTGPDGAEVRVRGRYLAGADGSRSTVRRGLGIELSGRSHEIQNLQTIFRAPGLGAAHQHGRAVQYWIVNEQVNGLMGPLDSADNWWAIILGAPEDPDPRWLRHALTTMIGAEHPVEVLARDPWTARMLVADAYRAGRCFLLGDAAHLNPPWGGFGANTGVGDAADLGWKLAAAVAGWAGANLLDSYQAERRPMALRTIIEAERNMQVLTGELARPELDDDGPAGERARAEAAEAIRRAKTSELYTLGFVLGASYRGSPIVIDDDEPSATSTTSRYRPSAAPGSRLPHVWLGPGRSLYDELGPGFTLLELGAPADPQWDIAADKRDVPLTRLHLHRPDLREVLGAELLLVRPDQHVAWRGHDRGIDVHELLDQVRGEPITSAW